MQVNRLGAGIFTIPAFLSPAECAEFVTQSEAIGYEEATINADEGSLRIEEERNNDRVILDDPELAAWLYKRAHALLPAQLEGWDVCGFNDRLRYYRYDKQQRFTWHKDGTVRISPTVESFLTFMIYLNDNFEGGSTDFGWESVRPSKGMALVFPHRLRHQGAVVTAGVKYVLRTDVLYSSNGA